MYTNSVGMYSFDFSLNRTISTEELQQIEQRVNDVIRYASHCLHIQLLAFVHSRIELLQSRTSSAQRRGAPAAGNEHSRPAGGVRRGLPGPRTRGVDAAEGTAINLLQCFVSGRGASCEK
jgi:hypothetical protein